MILGWSDQGEGVGRGIGTSEEGQKCIQSFIEHCGALAMVCDSLTLLLFMYFICHLNVKRNTMYQSEFVAFFMVGI